MGRAALAVVLALLAGPTWGQDLELSRTSQLLLELEREGLLTRREVDDARLVHRSLPALTSRLQHPDSGERLIALLALVKRGARSAPAVVRSLSDEDPTVRQVAARSLAALGVAPQEALPKLIQLLEDGYETVALRCAVADALANYGQGAGHALSPLLAAWHNPHGQLHDAATGALVALGPAAAPAIPALLAALEEESLRESAVRILAAVGEAAVIPLARHSDGGGLSPAQASRVSRDARPARAAARDALRTLGAAAVPALVELCRSERAEERTTGIRALYFLGKRAHGAALPLADLLTDPEEQVREDAAWALGSLGSRVSPAHPKLREHLLDERIAVRRAAAIAARRMGPNAREIAAPVVWALYDSDSLVRVDAAHALGGIHPSSVPRPLGREAVYEDARALREEHPSAADLERIPAYAERLKSPIEAVRIQGVRLLSSIGRGAQEALVRVAVDNTDASVRREALRALGRFGPAAAAVVARGLRDPHPTNRRLAGELLELCGPDAASTAPELVRSLGDSDPVVALQASLSLLAMEGAAEQATSPLIEVARRHDPEVRQRARAVLARLDAALRPTGRSLWWVPLAVHRETLLGILLLLGVWFFLAARSQRDRPGVASALRFGLRWGVPPTALAMLVASWAAAGPWVSSFYPRTLLFGLPFPWATACTAAFCTALVAGWAYLHRQRPVSVRFTSPPTIGEDCARMLSRLRGRLRPLPGVSGNLIRRRRPLERRAPRA